MSHCKPLNPPFNSECKVSLTFDLGNPRFRPHIASTGNTITLPPMEVA